MFNGFIELQNYRIIESQIYRFIETQIHRIATRHMLFLAIISFTYFFDMSDYISKKVLTDLFHTSVVYHRRRLREIFIRHYNPFKTDAVWTTCLPERIINDLRLHLSWDLGVRTFSWSVEAIGTKIIYRFKELGIFLFMKQVIINHINHNNTTSCK